MRLTEKINFMSGYSSKDNLYRPCNNSSKIKCYKKYLYKIKKLIYNKYNIIYHLPDCCV